MAVAGFNEQFDKHGAWRREVGLRLKVLTDWLKEQLGVMIGSDVAYYSLLVVGGLALVFIAYLVWRRRSPSTNPRRPPPRSLILPNSGAASGLPAWACSCCGTWAPC